MNRFKVVPVSVKCKGDSLWGKPPKVALKPTEGEISYTSWKPGRIEERLFISLSLYGENFHPGHYTDSGIPKGLMKSAAFKSQVWREVVAQLSRVGVDEPVPKAMSLDWSEQGLQPEGGWNFDVVFKS